MRVLLAGGGTAGHTSPLLATADALRRLVPEAEITCLGTPRGLENRVVPEAGYPLELIPPVPLPRKPNADLFKVPSRLRGAVKETLAIFDRVRPDVVVGYGGYVSMPAYLAARRRRLPLVVHEQNTLPGLANKAGARIAARVAVSFPDTPLPEGGVRRPADPPDDLPARPRARCGPRAAPSSASTPTGPTLLVTGGSQGARRLNQSVSGAARVLGEAGVQVLHVVGPKGEADARGHRASPTSCVALRRPDGPRLRRRRPGRLPGGRLQRHRGRGGRPARGVRAAPDRQRRAGAQRPSRRGRCRRWTARRRRGPHLGVGGGDGPGPGHRSRPARRDGQRPPPT